MTYRIIGMIPARYGSSRFPGKPLVEISGKSLIQRTYENAQRCKLLQEIYVATDDDRIFSHVEEFGGKAIMTSSNCPTGTERLAEAIHLNFKNVDMIINIQGDEPLLEPYVIQKVGEILINDQSAVMSTAAVKINTEEEALSRSVNKCVIDAHGNALYFSRSLIPGGHSGKWEPDTTYYKHLGIYGYRKDFLFHYAELETTPLQLAEDLEQLKVLEHGFKIKVAVVDSHSIGVDTPEDLIKVERKL
ncbi:3-deoxy-manno-octulosonate cytidylyltransferase [Waddlia chondrophila 2032/99]|uniref:3-deoxy-manno-octulosonate cytidylyltransferase n=1 Tax=Waddlia chondrophila 2032/99 TaxID=765953 RepID=F8LDQ5_9BACT|nr:3-deoxy-manno-octulosonate cytidylyltransferase [Waddlia chondrophila 2032/99]